MTYKIGSARSDERGKYLGGKPGDQKQVSVFDDRGEVSVQNFYAHPKGWIILRAKKDTHALKLSERMVVACMNKNIGYSQSDRYGIIKLGTDTKIPCNTDCSSLVRRCVKEATGTDPGDFNTASEASALMRTGLFDQTEYKNGTKLYTGDILVTKTKGHTVIVTEGESRNQSQKSQNDTQKGTAKVYKKYTGASLSLVDALQAVGESDTGMKHRKAIAAANSIEKYTGTAAQNDKLLQLLKAGKLKKA